VVTAVWSELLARFGSGVGLSTIAVFSGRPASVAVTSRVIVAVPPTGMSPSAQTTGSMWPQVPRVLEADRSATPAGSESVAVAARAVDGPALVTITV
jgi:hypothetical protein